MTSPSPYPLPQVARDARFFDLESDEVRAIWGTAGLWIRFATSFREFLTMMKVERIAFCEIAYRLTGRPMRWSGYYLRSTGKC